MIIAEKICLLIARENKYVRQLHLHSVLEPTGVQTLSKLPRRGGFRGALIRGFTLDWLVRANNSGSPGHVPACQDSVAGRPVTTTLVPSFDVSSGWTSWPHSFWQTRLWLVTKQVFAEWRMQTQTCRTLATNKVLQHTLQTGPSNRTMQT